MKLVIYTQIRENYAAHDWDGEGECPQYWKFKGGHTYVVENLTTAQAFKADRSGIPTLKSLIEERSQAYEEYVLSWEVLADDATVGEEWETPVRLSYINGRWTAGKVTENGEYGYMRKEIARKVEAWDMLEGGNRANYKVLYILAEDGRAVDSEALQKILAA